MSDEQLLVVVSVKQYVKLMEDSIKLSMLENYGIDNWEGYELALEDFNKEEIECELLKNLTMEK